MKKPVHRLIYSSRIALPEGKSVRNAAIAKIIDNSRKNNRRNDITGALFVNENCFIQVLEGPVAAVNRVFDKIVKDPRHSQPVVLESRGVMERGFAGHEMAFVDASQNQAAVMIGEFGIFPALRRIVSEQERMAA